jgi:hypothetical protein
MAQNSETPRIDGGVIDWFFGLAKRYGWPLAIISASVVVLIFLAQSAVQKATEKAVESVFAREGKLFELVAGRRSSFVQKVQTDRWEAVNDFLIRIERITTNLNRVRYGHEVPGLFNTAADGSKDIVPLTAVIEDLHGKQFLLGNDFYQLLWKRTTIALRFANAKSEEDVGRFARDKEANMRELERALDKVFRLAEAYDGID